jgi:hypothetical protein
VGDKILERPQFEQETATYERQKPALLTHSLGQFVVVLGDTLIGPYASYNDAFNEARRVFGDAAVLIKQVLPEEPVSFAPVVGTINSNAVLNCQYSI